MSVVLLVPALGGVLLLLALVMFIAYRRAWRIPAPNEALIIAGKAKGQSAVAEQEISGDVVSAIAERRTEGLDFRIATAATWVNPVTSRTFRLPLDSRSTEFEVQCHDTEKIAVTVKGVILYKVGDNYPAMAAAARRFLQMSEDHLNRSIRDLVTGQVRALVGGVTIPELITDRQKLIDAVRDATHEDMARLGLQIDSLSIQDVSDPTGYIDNLGRPQAEAVAREASIAADQARQAKEEAKQAAELEIARVSRDTALKQSEFQAERDRAEQQASQAGPLARAKAESDVVVEETKVAELQAEMAEKTFDAEIRRRADAERYKTEQEAAADKATRIAKAEAEAEQARLQGEADASAITARGDADAGAIEAKALAEARGIEARAAALGENPEAVIEQQIVEQMPEVARAFAEPLGAIDQMFVLDGAEGVSKGLVGAIAAAGNAVAGLRDVHRGDAPAPPQVAAGATPPADAPRRPVSVAKSAAPPEPPKPASHAEPESPAPKRPKRAAKPPSTFSVPTWVDPEAPNSPSSSSSEPSSGSADDKLSEVLGSAGSGSDIGRLLERIRSDDALMEAARRLADHPDREKLLDSLHLPTGSRPALRFFLDTLKTDE